MTLEGRVEAQPARLGPYVITRRLGAGALGVVDAGVEAHTGKPVALRSLMRAPPLSLARVKEEYATVAAHPHPNLLGVCELLERDGEWWLVTELVEGHELLAWVRPQSALDPSHRQNFDETRLRAAFAGIAAGLRSLHARGVLHRDLKPSNIRITADERAVVLDFGLVAAREPVRQYTHTAARTAQYMAPEQARGARFGPAADWYSFGSCLYHALTGELPFAGGSAFAGVVRKQRERPPDPRALCPQVPPDLDALCIALLDPSPDTRATAADVQRVFDPHDESASAPLVSASPSLGPSAVFEGRQRELEELRHALARTHDGQLSVVLVSGESGVGKTALMGEMLRRARRRDRATWVLAGRCYEHEQTAYSAFEGCLEALATALASLPHDVCQTLLPPHVGVLAQLFPVLRRVDGVARSPLDGVPAEPLARRRAAFTVFADLLGRLSAARPVILSIDDLQWADADSFRLLCALVLHSAPPPILIVATVRPYRELDPGVLKETTDLRSRDRVQSLPLRGLPQSQAQVLAQRLLGEPPAPERAKQIALQSMGNPMLISELAQFSASRLPGSGRELTLWSAVGARIAGLRPEARALIERVALCGRPLAEAFFVRLCPDSSSFADLVELLLAQKLLTRPGSGRLVCFHDRIRRAAVAAIQQAQLPALHADVATALEADSHPDLGALAYHWEHAGEPARALAVYQAAADAALGALAFAHAAALYGRALSLAAEVAPTVRVKLLVGCGHALACSGRGIEAAARYREAADRAEGEVRPRLRMLAAHHLLRSARVVEGLTGARGVLAELGMPLPARGAASLGRIGWERTKLRVRGLNVSEPARDVSPREMLSLDALYECSNVALWVDFLSASALRVTHLGRALAVGERGHVVRALSTEAAYRVFGAPGQTDAHLPLLSRCGELARASDDPALEALVALHTGSAEAARADLPRAVASLTRAHDLVTSRCAAEPMLLTHIRTGLGSLWALAGDYTQLATHAPGWRAEAEERQDRLAMAALAGLGAGVLPPVMRGDPDAARNLLSNAMEGFPAEPFALARHGELLATVQVELYRGGAHADDWLAARARYHDQALPYSRGKLAASLRLQRMLAALSAASEATPAQRKKCIARAEQLLPRGSSPTPAWLAAGVLSGRAQLSVARGDGEAALRDFSAARDYCLMHGMLGMATASAYVLGLLEGGEGGRTQCEAGLAFFTERGFCDAWSAVALHVPVVRLLESGVSLAGRARQLLHGRYQVGRPLPRGGFDSVVEALDTRTGRTVALKSLTDASPGDVACLKQQFRALQSVHHENLVRLDALFESGGTCTIAVEHVEGTDWTAYVRPGKALDEARLRAALVGVLRGAGALHEAGFVHRDLSPDTILITPEGRVVLRDFGLLGSIDVTQRDERDGAARGTVVVAPEQLGRADFDTAGEVYSIGACLYLALTGTPLFHQLTGDSLLVAKRHGGPVPPSAVGRDVPKDLEDLCLQMLERDPKARPSVAQALARLQHGVDRDSGPYPASERSHAQKARTGGGLFAGRVAELAVLETAFADARGGASRVVVVQGESGLGKTALVREFQRRVQQRAPQTLVLGSRCYENEQVSYQAFDAAVDELARALRRLPRAECEPLLTPRAGLLAQLFPVLGSVAAVGQASKKGWPAEPAERKREAVLAFATLLANLAARVPVVIAIDDVQWADLESFRLLRALCKVRAGPRPLIVVTRRRGEAYAPEVELELEQLCAWPEARVLSLGALTLSEASGLARALLGEGASLERCQSLVSAGAGHPLMLHELASYATAGPGLLLTGKLDLDEALRTRIDGLSFAARRLLEFLALAARPYPSRVFAFALCDTPGYADALCELRREELVRTRRGDDLLCYHDRVRAVVVRALPPDLLLHLSGRLASGLDREPDSDPGERAHLWEQAGKPALACAAHAQAGDAAFEVLAFARADAFYVRALELKGDVEDAERQRLLVRRGHVLVGLGRSDIAASCFLEAARRVHGAERIRLRVLATQHQLQSAQVEEGMANARQILSELGLPLSRGTLAAIARITIERGYLSLRGLSVPQTSVTVSAKDRLELDTLSGLLLPLTWVDTLLGASVNMRYLRRALAVGEPAHVARALMQEAAFRCMQQPADEAAYLPLLSRSREIAVAHGDPSVLAAAEFTQATVALFRSDPTGAERHLVAAHDLLLAHCPAECWLRTNVRMNLGVVWFTRDHARLAGTLPGWLQDADERQDAFALAALSGLGAGYATLLMRDAPDEARLQIERAMKPWPRIPFSLAHHGELMARTVICAYQGGRHALAWLDERATYHDRAFLHRTRFLGAALRIARVGALCAAYCDASGAERPELLRRMAAQVNQLDVADPTWVGAAALVCQTELAIARGELDRAIDLAERAHTAYTRLHMGMSVRAAEYLLGALLGGDSGRALCEGAIESYRHLGWKEPRRGLEMTAPIVRSLAR